MRVEPPERSARRSTVSGPVITQSGAVSPSPVPSIGWFDETERIVETGLGSTVSGAMSATLTATIWSLGGHSVVSEGLVLTTVGGVVSRTVTLNDPLALFRCESVAVHGTLVVPTGKVEPEAGEQMTATLPSTMSVDVAV